MNMLVKKFIVFRHNQTVDVDSAGDAVDILQMQEVARVDTPEAAEEAIDADIAAELAHPLESRLRYYPNSEAAKECYFVVEGMVKE